MEYFKSERLSKSITRIVDIAGVACYLIEGGKRACLLDTCCGYGNIKEYVEKITDKDLFVILTHGHYDHTGGASYFDEVYMHPADIPVMKKHARCRRDFWEEDCRQIVALEGLRFDDINIYCGKPLTIEDDTVVDMGNIHLRMVLTPGHTPGMMCVLLEEERVMFFGDACGMNVLLHDEFASSVEEYRKSLLHLQAFETRYDTIYRNHGSFTNEKDLLENVIECADLILSGKDDHIPVEMFGTLLYRAKAVDENGRLDGKQGNILYAEEKRKGARLCEK